MPRAEIGAVLVVVLIGMAVATMIFLSVLKLIAVQRQSVELQTRQIQAGWLAESAVQRAAARLSADADYRGETWNISAQDIGGRDGATIAIRVDDVAGKPDRRTVHVEADYPDDPYQRARQAREVIVRIPSQQTLVASKLKGPKPWSRPPTPICNLQLRRPPRFYARRTAGRHRHHRHLDRHDVPRGRARCGKRPAARPAKVAWPGWAWHCKSTSRATARSRPARPTQGTDPQCPAGHSVELDRALAPLSRRGGHVQADRSGGRGLRREERRGPQPPHRGLRLSFATVRSARRPARPATMPAAITTSRPPLPQTTTACCSSTATSRARDVTDGVEHTIYLGEKRTDIGRSGLDVRHAGHLAQHGHAHRQDRRGEAGQRSFRRRFRRLSSGRRELPLRRRRRAVSQHGDRSGGLPAIGRSRRRQAA